MVNLKLYLISYDTCLQKAVDGLTKEERKDVCCYAVGSQKLKLITARIKRVNEWQLPWHDNRYQFLQYYEYGILPHLVKNPELTEGLTHVGMLHNDVLFEDNTINNMKAELEENPNIIYYIAKRYSDVLYFTKDQLKHIAAYMEPKLDIKIDVEKIWNDGWISESMAIAPVEVVKKFGQFMLDYQFDFENILATSRWGLTDVVKHRNCGFVERMWGIYLMSCGMETKQATIIHDRLSYEHAHLIDKQKFLEGK